MVDSPARETYTLQKTITYPHQSGKAGKSSTQKCQLEKGHLSSQEGIWCVLRCIEGVSNVQNFWSFPSKQRVALLSSGPRETKRIERPMPPRQLRCSWQASLPRHQVFSVNMVTWHTVRLMMTS